MKEFEKYKFRCCKSCTVESCIYMCAGCVETKERKIGWKAALEWVNKIGEDAPGPEHNGYWEIMEQLQKELRDK